MRKKEARKGGIHWEEMGIGKGLNKNRWGICGMRIAPTDLQDGQLMG